MHKRRPPLKRRVLIIGTVIIVLAVLAGAYVFWQNNMSSEKAIAQVPSFEFNQSAAPEWWSSGTSQSQPGDPSDTPQSTMLVFQGTKEQPGNCFVMAFYNKGSVDIASTLKEREVGLIGGDDASKLHRVDTPLQTLVTPEGTKSYTLYQYNYDVPDVQQGNEFGFVQLKNGYVEVRGICPTSSLLHTTVVPLSGVTLK